MGASRREFLVAAGRLLIVLPAGLSIVACGSINSSPCGNPGRVVTTSTSLTFTSSCDMNHTHDFTLMMTELSTPPAAGIMRNTSVDEFDNHFHSVTLSQADLTTIESGTPVTVTTSVTNEHVHTYIFTNALS
jgi:hypothetical protein